MITALLLFVQTEGWQDLLQAPGTHWKLVFTAGMGSTELNSHKV
jgi:hypothetical protein